MSRDASGRVVFVPKTAPGDRVRVRIIEEEKKYAQGELLEILDSSPVRQKPRCPAFGSCGGCTWQHLPYELQWKTKSSGVQHALSRVKIELPSSFEEHPAERIWEYRNRVQLRGEGSRIGFHAAGSRDLVPVNRCDIARPEINSAWETLREEGSRLPKPYKVEVAVEETGAIRKVWNSRHGAAGFRQIHDDQNAKLRNWIANTITSDPQRVLFDLFGGSGNLSLGLAARFAEIHCVDFSAPSVRPEGVPSHFHFHRAGVGEWLARTRNRVFPCAGRSAILDPPREGLADRFSEIEEAICRMNVDELVAVGCDPDAWARDVSRFIRRSWRLKAVALFDFFPQTPHIESAALLVR